jgi:ribonuclease-3
LVFNQPELLELALTHRSRGAQNYERLEFLGDSILGFVVANWLYHQFPEQSEGKLSRMRSSLVRKETLAKVARDLDLGEFLILGEGELKSGGFRRDSILADTVESVIGAIYLDQGFAAAKQFVLTHFAELMSSITPATTYKDAKSRLQEAMQKRSMSLPSYTIVATSGQQHQQKFTVSCTLNELPIEAVATAASRRSAEQKSAALVLKILSAEENAASQ